QGETLLDLADAHPDAGVDVTGPRIRELRNRADRRVDSLVSCAHRRRGRWHARHNRPRRIAVPARRAEPLWWRCGPAARRDCDKAPRGPEKSGGLTPTAPPHRDTTAERSAARRRPLHR